jgi:uncharacterized membrane protein YkvI
MLKIIYVCSQNVSRVTSYRFQTMYTPLFFHISQKKLKKYFNVIFYWPMMRKNPVLIMSSAQRKSVLSLYSLVGNSLFYVWNWGIWLLMTLVTKISRILSLITKVLVICLFACNMYFVCKLYHTNIVCAWFDPVCRFLLLALQTIYHVLVLQCYNNKIIVFCNDQWWISNDYVISSDGQQSKM